MNFLLMNNYMVIHGHYMLKDIDEVGVTYNLRVISHEWSRIFSLKMNYMAN